MNRASVIWGMLCASSVMFALFSMQCVKAHTDLLEYVVRSCADSTSQCLIPWSFIKAAVRRSPYSMWTNTEQSALSNSCSCHYDSQTDILCWRLDGRAPKKYSGWDGTICVILSPAAWIWQFSLGLEMRWCSIFSSSRSNQDHAPGAWQKGVVAIWCQGSNQVFACTRYTFQSFNLYFQPRPLFLKWDKQSRSTADNWWASSPKNYLHFSLEH